MYSRGRARVVIVATTLALVAAACTSSGDTPALTPTSTSSGVSTTAPVAPTTTVAPPEPTTTTEPDPTEYPPGVVWEQTFLSGADERTITGVASTPVGWIVTTNRTSGAKEPSMFISTNGVDWTQNDLPTGTATTSVSDVTFGPAGYVAIGFAGTGCNPGCVNGNGVVWVSPDGETWKLVEPTVLTGPNKVVPHEIRIVDDRYVMVGKDQQDGVDQVFKVWSSTDGANWEVTAVLDDPDWAMHVFRGFTEWDGGYVITGSRAICRDPVYNEQGGWGYFITGRESKAWSSPDGVDWEEMDLAALGLIEPQDTETCDINDWASDEAIAAANGEFESIGGRLFWNSGTGIDSEIDGATGLWGPATRTIPDSVAAAETSALTVTDDLGFVSVGLSGLQSDQVTIAMARSDDLVIWEDWSSQTTPLDPLVDSSVSISPAFVVSNGQEILIVFQSQTASFFAPGPLTAAISSTAPIP